LPYSNRLQSNPPHPPLHPLIGVSLTSDKIFGSNGPNVKPICNSWRRVFNLLPPTVELNKLEMSHSWPFNTSTLANMIQHVTTVVHLRSGKKTEFEIVGASTRMGKAFVEYSMVGLRQSTRVVLGDGEWVPLNGVD
jgi:hypothetical protein